MVKRSTLVAVLLAMMMALSGCSVITGDGATYVADEAVVDASAASSTNFTQERSEWQNQTREVEVAGEERTVNVSTHVNAYTGSENESAFVALASPKIEVVGQEMNPLESMSDEALIERLESGFDGQGELADLERKGEYTVDAVGEERTVAVFSATAERGNETADIAIHVTKFTDGDDVVAGVAIHPESSDAVRSGVETMMAAIEHENTESSE